MKQFLVFFVVFFLFYIVLTGSFVPYLVVYCLLLSLLAAFIIVFIFKSQVNFKGNILKLFSFFFFLIKSIYASAFSTLFAFIKNKGNISAKTEHVLLNTRKGLHRFFICQAITLTPGTVSITSKTGSVTVLKFEHDTLDSVKKFDKKLENA